MIAVLDPKFAAALRDELVGRVTAAPKPWYRRRPLLIGAGVVVAMATTGAAVAHELASPGSEVDTALAPAVTATIAGTTTVDLGARPAAATKVRMYFWCLTGGTLQLGGGASIGCSAADVDTASPNASWVTDLPAGQRSWTFTADSGSTFKVQLEYVSATTLPWGVNADGKTFGVANENGSPDLVGVIASNGRDGYAWGTDLAGPPDPKSPADAVARTQWYAAHPDYVRCVPVYESDGKTRVGTFKMGNGNVDSSPCSPADLVPTP